MHPFATNLLRILSRRSHDEWLSTSAWSQRKVTLLHRKFPHEICSWLRRFTCGSSFEAFGGDRGNMGSPSLPFVRWNQYGNRVSVLWKIDKQAHPHVYDKIRCVLMGIPHPWLPCEPLILSLLKRSADLHWKFSDKHLSRKGDGKSFSLGRIVDESVLDQEPLTFGAETSMVARHRDRGCHPGKPARGRTWTFLIWVGSNNSVLKPPSFMKSGMKKDYLSGWFMSTKPWILENFWFWFELKRIPRKIGVYMN